MILKNLSLKIKTPSVIVTRILYGLSACFFVVSIYNFYYANRILPGVYVGDIALGGLTRLEAQEKILQRYSNYPNVVALKYVSNDHNNSSQEYYITLDDIGFKYDAGETYLESIKVGRSNFFSPLLHVVGFFKPVETIFPIYTYDSQKLNAEIATFAAQKYPQVSNAHFIFDGDELVVQEAQAGFEVDPEDTKAQIDAGFKNYSFSNNVSVKEYTPTIYSQDLEKIRNQVQNYLSTDLSFIYKNTQIKSSKENRLSLIDYSKDTEGNLKIVSNKYGIISFLNIVASKVDIEEKSTQFEVKDSGDIVFNPPIVGLSLDKDKLEADINKYISEFSFSSSGEDKTISLNVSETLPEQNVNDYGIKELVAEGVSYFSHSAANRVSNIANASQKIKGTLVAPGENFSFNDSVGPIDLNNGFNTAYVISKGRTVLGTGGGVCQVSTTVFRAALNAGLPIVKRVAHAYRVSYYEEKSPLGRDATIYQPSVDLIFKNDMENYILVYSVLDIEKSKLEVKIYGTKDGRSVDISDTKVLSEVPPPPAQYIDDPSLPKGTLVQEEWPAWGARTSFTRKVTKNDKVLYEDEFKSYYVPWAALYRRGV